MTKQKKRGRAELLLTLDQTAEQSDSSRAQRTILLLDQQHRLFSTRYHLNFDPVIVLNHSADILKHSFLAVLSTTHSYVSAPLIRLYMFYSHLLL